MEIASEVLKDIEYRRKEKVKEETKRQSQKRNEDNIK